MAVTVSGMFGNSKTYFADSPVVIDISGLQWPGNSPFNIVRIDVMYGGTKVGGFHADTGGQATISFDISSALRSIWAGYDFTGSGAEVAKAVTALSSNTVQSYTRVMRQYSLVVYTEYLDSQDGEFTRTSSGEISGGRCMMGGLTEWERSLITNKADADASHWNNTNRRYGDASTKPTDTPERVGRHSITSWVDVSGDGTTSFFYPAPASHSAPAITGQGDATTQHPPLVLRDSIDYTDFLFLNRRGAIETCSSLMLEALNMGVEKKKYGRVERPAFMPSRSVMTVRQGDPRRDWLMSSGLQTREWAEWWTREFLAAERHWMLYNGPGMAAATYVPVTVEPSKKSTGIYDRSKQQMPSVEFTVTLALEG